MEKQNLELRKEYKEKFGFKVADKSVHKTEPGLSERVIREISEIKGEKGEYSWINEFRLKALQHFLQRPMPKWGPDLSSINFDDIVYYAKPTERNTDNWEELPPEIKYTFDKLGIPEAERKFLSGVGLQFDSENVLHRIKEDLAKQGVIFVGPDEGLQKYPHIFKQWFGRIIPFLDNKFAALNSACFSGGSFIYIPKGVHVKMPLQAYFRINAEGFGQFERTLIIADEGSKVHYIEGCLPEGEEILVGDGIIPINEIKPNDIVLNSNGEYTSVKSTRVRQFEGQLIKITPVSVGNSFSLTSEHPVLIVKRDSVSTGKRKNRKLNDVKFEKLLKATPEFVPAGKLKEGDFLVFPINKMIKDDPKISNSLLQFLGYYLAEGYTGKTNGYDAVILSFNQNEKLFIDHTKDLIKDITGKDAGEINVPEKNETRVYIYSNELVKLSEEHCGKYAEKKRLSKIIMELPPKRQLQLLRTYYLGDGNTFLRKSIMIRANTASKHLAFQFQELLARQGIFATINEREGRDEMMKDGKIIHHKKLYTIYYAEDKHSELVKFVNGNFLVPIRSIKSRKYSNKVFNFLKICALISIYID